MESIELTNDVVENSELINRPSSMYDNIQDNTTNNGQSKSRHSHRNPRDDVGANVKLLPDKFDYRLVNKDDERTITFLTNTTVPQNISAEKLSKRHTPTTRSLRHSRMVVMNRTGQVNTHPITELFKFSIFFEVLKASIGLILTAITVWLLLWAPSFKTRENPYWCGIPLLASGLFGLIVVCCLRKMKIRNSKCCPVNYVEVISIISTILSGILCFIAFILIVIHIINFSKLSCAPISVPNSSCVCTDTELQDENGAILPSYEYTFNSFHFIDLKCADVKEILTIIFIIIGVATAMGFIFIVIYSFIYIAHFKSQVYSEVNRIDYVTSSI